MLHFIVCDAETGIIEETIKNGMSRDFIRNKVQVVVKRMSCLYVRFIGFCVYESIIGHQVP
jgi:hypothetical protein